MGKEDGEKKEYPPKKEGGYGGEKKDLSSEKKEFSGEKKEGYGDKKEGYGDKKEGYGQEKEPSAELKAAMKACQENELCKKLMECKKKHKESGGKGDGKATAKRRCVW